MTPEMPAGTSAPLSASDSFVPQQKRLTTGQSWVRQAGQMLMLLACAVLSYWLISHFFVQSVRVVGMSMVPNLRDSQFYLLNRWVLHFREPQRSEIVVLRDPLDGGYAVKRVIGVAGDSIDFHDGQVFINGRKLKEPYLLPGTKTFGNSRFQHPVFHCHVGQFFVLGDNRSNSLDSRTYGPVSRRNILGLIVQ